MISCVFVHVNVPYPKLLNRWMDHSLLNGTESTAEVA